GMDRAFGKLRQSLETLGMRENTLLWYCSDNGALPKVGRTGGFRADKGDVYDGGLLVPSILEWPARFPKPAVIEARSNTFDILPTVLELAQIDRRSAHQLDGESLLPLLEETATQRTRPMGFWDNLARGISTPSENWMQELKEAQAQGGDLPPNSDVVAAMALPDPRVSKDSFPGHSAWIDGDWKLHRIESKAGQVKVELYDLKSDPFEETDLAGENPDRVEAMQTALQEWLSDVVDSLNGEEYES
ncbi:MAG: sulfatase-like hydrolase/transferase, partial [Verrucomicrobiota bacterium]